MARLLAELRVKGMTFNELSAAEPARIRDKLKPVVERFSRDVGPGLVTQTCAEIDKVRAQKP